jgi:hypothetical protein
LYNQAPQIFYSSFLEKTVAILQSHLTTTLYVKPPLEGEFPLLQ